MNPIAARTALALSLFCVAAPAHASGDDWGLNGTYAAVSNGDWAQTNDVYRDETTIRNTWTIHTSCTTPVDCTGRISSDAGWSADVTYAGSEYVAKRDIPNWEPCPDGSRRTGHQVFRFYPVNENGWFQSVHTPSLASTERPATAAPAASIRHSSSISHSDWTRSAEIPGLQGELR